MKKTLLSIATLFFCSVVIGQNGTDLRMNPEKNKVYRFRSISEQTILQTVNGNQQTIESETNYTISLKMIDATQAFIVAEVRFDTMSTKTNSMGKVTAMSSASEGNIQSKETSDIMSYFMNRMSRNPLYTKIDFTGKVIEVVNSKMVSDMILKDTSLITLDDPAGSALKGQIASMTGAEAFKTIIDMFTNNLPGKSVNAGDSWTVTTQSNAGGMSLDITTIHKLESISGNSANISAESNIRASANAGPMKSGGAEITYDDLKGLGKSTIVIDVRTGLVAEAETKTHITGNLGVTVPGMNMVIPMDINSNTKVASLQ